MSRNPGAAAVMSQSRHAPSPVISNARSPVAPTGGKDTYGFRDPLPGFKVNFKDAIQVLSQTTERSAMKNGLMSYLAFLVVYFFVITAQRSSSDSYQMEGGLRDFFIGGPYTSIGIRKQWEDVASVDDFWEWLEFSFFPNFYEVYSDSVPEEEKGFVTLHNKLLGGFTITQRRSGVSDECVGSTAFRHLYSQCQVDLHVEEATDSYRGFDYEERVRSIGLGLTILEKGYFIDFTDNVTIAMKQLQRMKDDRFIDQQTREFQIEFVAFNLNIHTMMEIRFLFQFLRSGRMLPFAFFDSLLIDAYVTTVDWVRMAFEIVLIIFTAWFAYEEGKELLLAKRQFGSFSKYFRDIWNYLDIIQIVMLMITIIFWMALIFNPMLKSITPGSSGNGIEKPLYGPLARASYIYFLLNAICMLISVVKLLKYFRCSPKMSAITQTFSLMYSDLFHFLFAVVLFTVAFAIMGTLLFGPEVGDWSNFLRALDSVFSFLVGYGDYAGLKDADPVGGPFFFYPFIFLMVIVLLNMVIAIIMDNYNIVQEERKANKLKEESLVSLINLAVKKKRARSIMAKNAKEHISKQEYMDVFYRTEYLTDEFDVLLSYTALWRKLTTTPLISGDPPDDEGIFERFITEFCKDNNLLVETRPTTGPITLDVAEQVVELRNDIRALTQVVRQAVFDVADMRTKLLPSEGPIGAVADLQQEGVVESEEAAETCIEVRGPDGISAPQYITL